MPLDSSDAKKIYIASAVGIVLVLLVITQLSQRQAYKYAASHSIAVKTSQGLIKMRADAVADMLANINAELQRFKGTNVTPYTADIKHALANLKQTIDANPKKNLCNLEKKLNIMDKALSESITYDENAASQAWKTIVEQDSIENKSDSDMFVHLLRNIETLIHLLHSDICEDGILDLERLEALLHTMERDLVDHGRFEMSPGTEISNRNDPYEKVPGERLFIREQEQLEGFDSRENYKKPSKRIKPLMTLGVYNKLQDRSDSFRADRECRALSHTTLDDATLLCDDFTGYL